MVVNRIAVAAAMAVALLLASCQTTNTLSFGDGSQLIDEAGLPAPARAALTALHARLSADGATGGDVRGLEDAEPVIGEHYPGFRHLETQVTAYEADVGDGVSALGGRYVFADAIDRRVAVGFRINYRAGADGAVDVERFGVLPVISPDPHTEAYVVRLSAVKDSLETASGDFTKLYRLARDNALAPGVDPEQEGEYGVFVFYKDRLFPGGRIETRMDNKEGGKGPKDVVGKALRYGDGDWGAALIAGRFKLDPEKPYWVKALYATDAGADLTVVGRHAVRPAAPSS